jgi:hypothetical protein
MGLFRRRKAAASNTAAATEIYPLDPSDIDIWAMRDTGYLDPEGLKILREQGVTEPLEIDYEVEPDGHQKQRVIEQYAEMAAYLNKKKVDGRRDWTPQAWSLPLVRPLAEAHLCPTRFGTQQREAHRMGDVVGLPKANPGLTGLRRQSNRARDQRR